MGRYKITTFTNYKSIEGDIYPAVILRQDWSSCQNKHTSPQYGPSFSSSPSCKITCTQRIILNWVSLWCTIIDVWVLFPFYMLIYQGHIEISRIKRAVNGRCLRSTDVVDTGGAAFSSGLCCLGPWGWREKKLGAGFWWLWVWQIQPSGRLLTWISSALFQSIRNILDWEAWRQTLICIKWQVLIIRLRTWKQGPIAWL